MPTPNVIAWRQRRCAISSACHTVNGGMLLSHAEVRRRGAIPHFAFCILNFPFVTVNGSLCNMLLSHAEARRRGAIPHFAFCILNFPFVTVNGSLCDMLLSHAEVRRRGAIPHFNFQFSTFNFQFSIFNSHV